jgi:signal transduction histidine kinase
LYGGVVVLHEFLAEHFDELLSRMKAKAAAGPSRSAATPGGHEPGGVPQLLAQLGAALRSEPSTASGAAPADAGAAARHARALLESGWAISQVVHDYGDLREAIAELAAEQGRASVAEEPRALSRGVDQAIADGVAEYARLKDEATSHREVERLGRVTHELRNQLQTALLSLRALRSGKADIGGSAGDALGRSLARLRELIDTRLSADGLAGTSRVSLTSFVHEVAAAAHPDAEHREIRLTIEPGDPALAVDVDPRLLASALMNLLQNAFENTRAHGRVTLRIRGENGRAFVEVEDECGGMGTRASAPRRVAGERRASDRVAPGRGLSSSRRDVQSNGGEVHVHNLPGKGCVFGIELPLAAPLDSGP